MEGTIISGEQKPEIASETPALATTDAAEGASSSASTEPPKKPPYPAPSAQPTQRSPTGILFDFNAGARLLLPSRTEGKWRVRLADLDTGNTLFQSENQGAFVSSAKRYYVRIGIDVWDVDADGNATSVLSHAYDARDRDVLIQLPVGTIGDTVGWFPYVARFAAVHGARVICAMSGLIIPILRDAYPEIRFVTHEEVEEQKIAASVYATYSIGLFFTDKENIHQPTDFRHVGLHRTAGYILGVSPQEEPPRLALPDESRPIAEPYVCIAVQASTQSKYWNNPRGWYTIVRFLKERGFRVICIDKMPMHGGGLSWNHIPNGAEDETGDRPLAERARWLHHAAFFVGLSSGISWLAWAAGTPVVLISGFTHPTNEFDTPYRIVNWHACNSCWNDPRLLFDHKDFLWRPRHAGTPRQFECTRLITPEQVTTAIEKIPAFIEHAKVNDRAAEAVAQTPDGGAKRARRRAL